MGRASILGASGRAMLNALVADTNDPQVLQLAPFAAAVELFCTIPGVQQRTAEVIVAEIGVDISRFPSDRDLASWAGQCSGNDRSAGRRRSGKTRHGSKWLDTVLTEAAMAATLTSDVYLTAQYQRVSWNG